MSARRRIITALAGVLTATMVTGCSLDLEDLPAPNGTSGDTYRLDADFTDVQNLTLGAKVKLGGVVVGDVESITTHDYRAVVGLAIDKTFRLGRDAHLQVRFTTPLGEQFISITARGNVAAGALPDGARLTTRNTSNAPGIEDTFAALSTLLNHGGLDNLHTIATELDRALSGRGGQARDILVQVHKVIVNLDAHKDDIDRSLDSVARLAKTLNDSTPLVEEALDILPDTMSTLAADTGRLRQLLTKVATLGTTIDGMLSRSEGALLTDLDNLRPTLAALHSREAELMPTFQSLIKLGQLVHRAAPGDYLNLSITIKFLLDANPARPQRGGVVRSGAEPSSDGAVRQLLVGGLT